MTAPLHTFIHDFEVMVIICDIRHKIQCKISTNATNPASNDSTTKVNTYFDHFSVYVMPLNSILFANQLNNFCYCYCAGIVNMCVYLLW